MEFYIKMLKDSNRNLVKNPKMKRKKNILRQKNTKKIVYPYQGKY